jgi:proline racemase
MPKPRGCRVAGAARDLRALGMSIAREVERLRHVVHPEDAGLSGIYGTIFTGPPQGEGHLRNVTVFADAEVDRSPCGTGTAAVMAVLAEMGVLMDDVPFVHESIVGTTFTGAWCAVPRSASVRRLCRRSKAVPGLPASMSFSSMVMIR